MKGVQDLIRVFDKYRNADLLIVGSGHHVDHNGDGAFLGVEIACELD